MKEVLVITDLTQMPEGDRVCVVGINPRGESIRPVNQGGFLKKYLYDAKGKVMVRPGAKVQFDLSKTDVNPPHIEDMIFDTDSITGEGMCSLDEWEKTLQVKPFQTVNKMFDGLIQGDGWVLAGAKTRSIGTLMEPKIVDINLTPGSIKPRVKFVDDSGSEFERPVNDLSMWDRCHYLVKNQNRDIVEVKKELLLSLQRADRLYLRLGLARPWEQDGKCWLQVTGVYTFPDYLDGKCFNDF